MNGQARIRDPERRERILEAAVGLIAKHGYLGVNLTEIGAAAGIVGSGIYRHFDTKAAILVEMFDRVVDRLVADAELRLRDAFLPEKTLSQLVRGQVDFTLGERALCAVYLQELHNVPEQDLRRLKWKQRHYVDLWQDLLLSANPALSPEEAQVRVHAAIAAVHSVLKYRPQAEQAVLAGYLHAVACGVLGVSDATSKEAPSAVEASADSDAVE